MATVNLSAVITPSNVLTNSNTVSGITNKSFTSPTFVTPALGTPASGVATNLTGLPLTTGVTGTLPVANGGTGAATLTANYALLGNGTSALQMIAPSTSGNVLTSNGTTWASTAASGGDIVLVKTASFSAVANTSTTFDGVFTSTYKSYRVVFRQMFGGNTAVNPVLNLRVGASTNSTAEYYYYFTKVTGAGATAVVAANTQTSWPLPNVWTVLGSSSSYYMDFTGVGASYELVLAPLSGLSNAENAWYVGGVRWQGSATTFTGFIITTGSSTITGTIDVYGYK